jgi:hypothetical protein
MAGLEERLSKLESILHRLFCCDTNQFTGPQGPQGPQGEAGLQGPPGADGAVGPAGLNWQGTWTSCVVYQENDAVGYNGASYYVTCETSESSPCYSYEAFGTGFFEWVDCEGVEESITLNGTNTFVFCSITPFPATIGNLTFDPISNPGGVACGSTACVPPNLNPCFALLASQGATGPQGPTGIGISGNDGSNSGRWKFLTTINNVGAPGSTYFVTNTLNLNALSTIIVNFDDINTTDYEAWWTALYDFGVDYPGTLFFIQITEVGSNNIIGIYQVDYKSPSFDMTLFSNRISIGLNPMYVSNSVFTPNKNYTISWSIHGGVNGGNAPKTKGEVFAQSFPGPYPTLEYDFNEASSSIPWNIPALSRSYVALPTPTVRGQQLYLTTRGDNDFAVISHNGSYILNVYGLDGGAGGLIEEFVTYPGDMYKFTWDGDYWIVENLEGQANFFNGKRTQEDKFSFAETYYDNFTSTFPTQAWLNTTYPDSSYAGGSKIFFTAITGGPRCFVKMDATNWQSYSTTTVI